MKLGLILEGGAMRGMFTAGVIDVMMEHGIEIDGIIGVSAGAAFGCNYKSNQPGRVIRYTTKYSKHPKYCGFGSLIKTGNFYGTDFCYHEIPEKLDLFDEDTFCKSPTEFYVTCTDVETGEAIYHKCEATMDGNIDWIRASASLPLVSRIVTVDGKKLLDGSISDSIPLKYFQSIGYKRNIVILTRPKGYTKEKNKILPLMKLVLRKYPKLIEVIKNRHFIYNKTLNYIWESETLGETLVICPSEPLPIERTEREPDKLRAVYEIGRKIGLEYIDDIKQFIENTKSIS